MAKKFLPYTSQSITSDDTKAVTKALKGDWITRGPIVQEFEQKLAESTGAQYAVLFNSGTTALEAATFAAEVSEHDNVITTPNTFIGTVTGALKRKARLTLIDIDPKTGNIDLDQLEERINQPSSRGREILMPVHFSGIAVDIERIKSSIKRVNTVIIEDAAHAFGSTYPNGAKVGSCELSDMTIFSFHPAKQLTTGEGGAVMTNDPTYYERLRLFRNNGIVEKDPFYEVVALTGNTNFTDFQAALGLSQLSRVDEMNQKRSAIIEHYRKKLKEIPEYTLTPEEYDARTSYHLFVVQCERRDELREFLKEKNIGSQVHYIPLYHHPVIKGNPEQFPNTETFFAKALSLPLSAQMKEEDVDRVLEALKAFITKK